MDLQRVPVTRWAGPAVTVKVYITPFILLPHEHDDDARDDDADDADDDDVSKVTSKSFS